MLQRFGLSDCAVWIRSFFSWLELLLRPNFAGMPRLPALAVGLLFMMVCSANAWSDEAASWGTEHEPSSAASNAAETTAARYELPIGISPTLVIDALVERGWHRNSITPSVTCDDATFVRRIYLDLAGRVPTSEERQQFLQAANSDKREQLVDRLLASDAFANHFADLFDGMLLGRRGSRAQGRREKNGWRDYLVESFRENRPWNQMARDMVLARATDTSDVRGGWFLYERRDRHQEMAEAVAPNFFGIRIECAQCHDHPLASEIHQAHYWGLVSFFSRSKNENTKAGPRVVEDAIGGFLKYSDLGGDNYEAELTFFDGATVPEERPSEEKKEATDEDFRDRSDESQEPRVPKFSRREEFADEVLAKHPLVARAFVNRAWALVLGRGLVHPFNEMDSMHSASHPELLDWLSDDFRASGYDVKRLIKALVMSEPYQLDSRPADEKAFPEHFAFAITKPLTADSLLRSVYVVTQASTDFELDENLLAEFRETFPDILPDVPTSRVGQAMLLTNESTFNHVVLSSDGPLLQTLLAEPQPDEQVTLAFEAVLGRLPTSEERTYAAEYLLRHRQPNASTEQSGVGQLVWALITSAEFRINH